MFAANTIDILMKFINKNIGMSNSDDKTPEEVQLYYSTLKIRIEILLKRYLGTFIVEEKNDTFILLKDYRTGDTYECKLLEDEDRIEMKRQSTEPIKVQDTIVEFIIDWGNYLAEEFLIVSLENGICTQHKFDAYKFYDVSNFYDADAMSYYLESAPIVNLIGFYTSRLKPDLTFDRKAFRHSFGGYHKQIYTLEEFRGTGLIKRNIEEYEEEIYITTPSIQQESFLEYLNIIDTSPFHKYLKTYEDIEKRKNMRIYSLNKEE